MNREAIVKLLDQDIECLEQARALLVNSAAVPSGHRFNVIPGGKRKKRNLSADARARIAAAQKRRWAKVHAAQKRAA